MNNLFIPPNYDNAKYKLLGLFSISAIIEGAVAAFLFFIIFQDVCRLFISGLAGLIFVLLLTGMVFFGMAFLADRESLIKRFKRMIKFHSSKRNLKYRRIKTRKKLTLPPILQKEFGISGGTLAVDPEEEEDEKENEEEIVQSEFNILKNELVDSFKVQENKASKQDYTQEAINVCEIQGGMIRRKDGHYIKIIELSGINFNNLKDDDVLNILNEFVSYLRIGSVYTQFKIMTFRPNLTDYINNFQNNAQKVIRKNPAVSNIIDDITNDLIYQSQYNTLEHRYLMIMSYKPHASGEEGRLEAQVELNTYAGEAEDMFKNCGNYFVKHEDEDVFLHDILYRHFNRRSFETEPLSVRYNRVRKDTATARGIALRDAYDIKPHHIVAPKSIDLTNKDYIYMDGLYYTYLTFSDYPAGGVPAGWLKRFSNAGEGFDFDIIIRRENRERIQKDLNQKVSNMQGCVPNMPANSQAHRVMANTLKVSEDYTLEKINNGQDMFNFVIIITIFSKTFNDMQKRRRWIIDNCKTGNYSLKTLNFQMEDAFAMTAPLCEIRKEFFEANRRNTLSEGLASLYPMTTTTVSEPNGISLGISLENSAPIIFDPFKPISNMLVFGVTSYGKSYTTMTLATRLYLMQETQVFVLSPSKGHEYIPIVNALGGVHIPIGPGQNKYINIMEVRPAILVNENAADESDVIIETSFLADKIQDLMKFFKLACPNITQNQRDMLNPELMSLYKEFGITDDNNTVFTNNDRETNELKKMPIIGDLYSRLLFHEDPEMQALCKNLKVFVAGNLQYFNHETNVDLDNMFCVIDLESVRKTEYYSLALFVAQRFIWRKVKANRTQKKCILFEEMWQLLNDEESADLLDEIIRTIRGYGGIMCSITQRVKDLSTSKQGEAILDNSLTKIIMHLESTDALEAKNRFNLNQNEYARIVNAKKGEALICTPKDHYATQIRASQSEAYIFETDREKLAANYAQLESGEKAS